MRLIRRRLAVATRPTDDGGFVLIMVIAVSLVLTLLVTAVLNYAVSDERQVRKDQDYYASLSAAESGIEDYISRLNENTNYWQNAGVDSSNAAFTGWVEAPGQAVNSATYTYSVVDAAKTTTDGIIRLQVKGKVGNRVRTLRADLKRSSFTDYVYFSNVEVNDPDNRTKYVSESDATRAALRTGCAKRAWEPRTQGGCLGISWVDNDVVHGKIHTNDIIGISNATFDDRVESGCGSPCGDMSGGQYKNYIGTGGTFADPRAGGYNNKNGFGVLAVPASDIPPSNISIKVQAQSPNTGCLYTGPTRIVLRPSGKYDVYSPYSRATNGAGCGTMDASGKATNVDYPDNGVIYVQWIPTAPSDPNYTPDASVDKVAPWLSAPKPRDSPSVYRPNPNSTATLPVPDAFPLPEDRTPYSPSAGDVFVDGDVKGQLTIAAQNDIIITGDIRYKKPSEDLLGLVANGFLWNYHPVSNVNTVSGSGLYNCNGAQNCSATTGTPYYELCPGECLGNVTIDGSLMSVGHGYATQWPDVGGNMGTIFLNGSLTQFWRSNVGGGSSTAVSDMLGSGRRTGYAKNYSYDAKLNYLQPPHFLNPTATEWRVKNWAEVTNTP